MRVRARTAETPAACAGEPQTHKYLYCIILGERPMSFVAPGVAGPEYPVYSINHRGVAAVVSDSPEKAYESTRRNMTAHMRVLEEVMREHAILPIRFNSVSPGVDAVFNRLLKPGYDEFRAQLAKVNGRVEMGVKAMWREDALYNEVVAENEPIRRLRDRVAGRSPEATYRERIRLGEMVEAALNAKRDRESAALLASLSPCAEDVRLHEPVNERMALNAALFLKANRQAALESSLSALDEQHAGRMTFKCVGPVPPYNFVEITLG